MWLSADPALGEYIPAAPVSDEARRHNLNLPGMGGVYNSVNLNLYHYAGNNPVKYIDPAGLFTWDADGQGGYVDQDDSLSQITVDYNRNNGTNYTYQSVADLNGIEDPDKLTIGQHITFKKEKAPPSSCLGTAADVTGYTSDALVFSFQYLSSKYGPVVRQATSSSGPWVSIATDPLKYHNAKVLYDWSEKIGYIGLGLSIGFSIWNGIDVGIQTGSFWHGAYKAVQGILASGLGYVVGSAAGYFITPAGGVFVAEGVIWVVNFFGDALEKKIWK